MFVNITSLEKCHHSGFLFVFSMNEFHILSPLFDWVFIYPHTRIHPNWYCLFKRSPDWGLLQVCWQNSVGEVALRNRGLFREETLGSRCGDSGSPQKQVLQVEIEMVWQSWGRRELREEAGLQGNIDKPWQI